MVTVPSADSSPPYRSRTVSEPKREPKHQRCFWEKSKIQNPKSKIQNLYKKNCYIRLQNPKSKIKNQKSKIRNPKSKIQNSRENPKFGAVGASREGMLHNDPKSKIQTEKVWILDFGFGNLGFWVWDSGFWILGGSGGCTTRQFSDGALRSEARIHPGPSRGRGAEPTVSDTVGEREGTWWWKQEEKEVKPIFFHVFWDFTCRFGLFEGNQNQLYLIHLGGERTLGNRNERRREGKRWATLPPTVSDTVGFGYF